MTTRDYDELQAFLDALSASSVELPDEPEPVEEEESWHAC